MEPNAHNATAPKYRRMSLLAVSTMVAIALSTTQAQPTLVGAQTNTTSYTTAGTTAWTTSGTTGWSNTGTTSFTTSGTTSVRGVEASS